MKMDSEVTNLPKGAERILHRERQTMSETVLGDGKWAYLWIVDRKLVEVEDRMLDQANGKPCQGHCRAMASEIICGLLIGSRLTALRDRENTRSSQRQTCRG